MMSVSTCFVSLSLTLRHFSVSPPIAGLYEIKMVDYLPSVVFFGLVPGLISLLTSAAVKSVAGRRDSLGCHDIPCPSFMVLIYFVVVG